MDIGAPSIMAAVATALTGYLLMRLLDDGPVDRQIDRQVAQP